MIAGTFVDTALKIPSSVVLLPELGIQATAKLVPGTDEEPPSRSHSSILRLCRPLLQITVEHAGA